MPIGTSQREKNTHNKLKAFIKHAEDTVPANSGQHGSKGYLSRKLEGAAKAVKMDEDTGSNDYSGGPEEHMRHKSLVHVIKREATTNKKRQALTNLARQGYGDYGSGHDMTIHGEGKEHGKE